MREAFDRDGFVVVPEFLHKGEIGDLTWNILRYIAEVVPTHAATDAFYQDGQLKQIAGMERDFYFAAMMAQPRWLALAEALLGEPCENHAGPSWFNKPPGIDHPTPPHQDGHYYKLDPPVGLHIWVALDAADEENGCLRFVRGSHKRGLRPHERSTVLGFSQVVSDWSAGDEASEVAVSLEPGDAVVHHMLTIHRADANRSPRHRRAYCHIIRAKRAKVDAAAWDAHRAEVREHLAAFGVS